MAKLPTGTRKPIPAAQIEVAIARHAASAHGAFSPNTERAWRSDTAVWTDWCLQHDHTPLPADPGDLVEFLEAQSKGKALSTLRRYRSSIGRLHRAARLPDPTTEERVGMAIRRIARRVASRPTQATGLARGAVDRMLRATPDTATGQRNAALLAVAYDSMARRSELVALNVDDLAAADDGSATVLIRRSKTDPEGEGRVAFLAPDTVRTVGLWLTTARLDSGAIFRRIRRGSHVDERLDAGSVATIFREMAVRAGIDPTGVSAHSTRIGAAQDQVAAGLELGAVMQAGGWRSPAMVARYSEHILAGRSGAAQLARLQGRA